MPSVSQITEEAIDWMKRNRLWIAIIPGGLTPVLQPLDILVNHLFKVHFRQAYQRWLLEAPGPFLPGLSHTLNEKL